MVVVAIRMEDDKSSDNDIAIVVPRDILSTHITLEVQAIMHITSIYTYYLCRIHVQLLTTGRPFKMSLQKTTLSRITSSYRL